MVWAKENELKEAFRRLEDPAWHMSQVLLHRARRLFEEREVWRKFNGGYKFRGIDYWSPERQQAEIEKLRHGLMLRNRGRWLHRLSPL